MVDATDFGERFKDADPVARLASTLLERCLNFSVGAFDFDAVMGSSIQDRLLCRGGVARVPYVPYFGAEIAPQRIAREGKEAVANANNESRLSDPKS
jgi:hypothetical protein